MSHVTNRVMRIVTAFALVLSVPALVMGQAPAVPASFLITPGQGIGRVQLGMTVEQVRAALGHEASTASDPITRATTLAWKTAGAGRFGVWFRDGKAVNIGINRDPRYATAQGLRDGDAADKVLGVMGASPDTAALPTLTLGRLQVLRYPGILFYVPSGAEDATLDGKVYSIIIVAAGTLQVVAPSSPPAQTQPAPAAPVQTQPASPAPAAPARPAPPAQPAPPVQTRPAPPAPAAPAQPAPGSPAVIVPGQSIGAVRLGMKLADVTGLFGTSTDTVRSSDGSVTRWWLDASKRQGFGVQVSGGNRVDRLSIMNDASYTTAAGLHAGSTEAEIRAALGVPAAVNVDAKSHRETLRYDDLGVWFEIELDKQSPAFATVVAIDVLATAGSPVGPAAPSPSHVPEPDRPETGGQ